MRTDGKALLAEGIGCFFLVFVGTAAIVINELDGAVTHVGVALVFGLVVFALIATLGDVSGAHLNPAVTVAFYLARRFPARAVLPYVGSQVLGAILASGTVRLLFPQHGSLGATVPAGPALQSWVLELILTGLLMFVILSVSHGAKERGVTAGLAIGGVVAVAALFAGPICGASMNPARSLAPALVSGEWDGLWIYLSAPMLGAALAVPGCRAVRDRGCCEEGEGSSA